MAESDYVISITIEGKNTLSGTLRASSEDLKRFSTDSEKAGKQVSGMDRSMQTLNNTFRTFMGGAVLGVGIRQVIGFAEEMNALGHEVSATSRLFEQMGGNQTVLAQLRDETRGLVDDLSLMRGAGDFMNLGITNSMEETARLIGMIEAVKKPTESTAEALNNFSLMMANQSVLRLDSFGLSSARVKARMEELKESLNMTSEAAFTRAVLEELEGKVTSLGDAAFASESNLLRLQNRITNVGQTAAAETNNVVEFYAGIAEGGIETVETLTDWGAKMRAAEEMLFGANLGQQILPGAFYSPEQQRLAAFYVNMQDRLTSGIGQAGGFANTVVSAMRAAATQQMTITDNLRAFQAQFGADPDQVFNPDRWERLMFDIQNVSRGSIGGALLFTEDEARRAQMIADSTEYMVSIIDDLQPFIDQGLISQADADNMKDIAKDAQTFAAEVTKGAEAYRNMSLSQMIGTTSGGAMGELTDRFLAVMRDRGVSDTTLQEYQQTLDLASGRETNLSQGLDEFLLQLSYMSPNEVATAMDNLQTFLREARRLNLPADVYNPGNYAFFSGMTGAPGASIDVQSGDTLYSLAGRYGGSWQDYRSLLDANGILHTGTMQIGGTGSFLPGFDPLSQAQALASSLGMVGDNFGIGGAGFEELTAQADVALDPMIADSESVLSTFEGVRSIIDDMTGTAHKVTVDLDLQVNAPAILQWLFNQTGGDALANIVRANGGVVPGSDPRSRQIER